MFNARDRDPDTLLYNYRYRYYSAGLGRFVQPDPIIRLNRDPLGEEAFEIARLRHRKGLAYAGESNAYLFVKNSPTSRVDLFGLMDLLPEKDSQSSFQNCLTKKLCAPGFGSALKKYTWMHIMGGFGTAGSGLAAGLQGFINPVADACFAGFLVFDVVDAALTVNEFHRLREKAKSDYAGCLMGCAKKWNDWEGAWEQWEIFKGR
jgi:RHS repeat-associated protein